MISSKKIILEAKSISKYFGTLPALENVKLSIKEGE
jgi:ABC-type sugar transport system ATPase subunit